MPEWATQPALCSTTIFKVFFECARTLEFYVASWVTQKSIIKMPLLNTTLFACLLDSSSKKVSTKMTSYVRTSLHSGLNSGKKRNIEKPYGHCLLQCNGPEKEHE